jgi:hypothetical protein
MRRIMLFRSTTDRIYDYTDHNIIVPLCYVQNFNYLGYILNADNKMNTEIAERGAEGNKPYYAVISNV